MESFSECRDGQRDSCFLCICIFIFIHVYIYIPGSSRYVKFLPFGSFFFVKRHKFYTLGRSRYIYI